MGEANRLKALDRYQIGGEAIEPALQDIIQLASELFQCPIAIVNMLGETECTYKGSIGSPKKGVLRSETFCQEVVLSKETLVIEDTHLSEKYRNNVHVQGEKKIRFYAGAPLITSDGFAIGTFCVLSPTPKEISFDQRSSLERLAKLVMRLLEDRVKVRAQEEQKQFLDVVLENLSDGVVACNENSELTLFNGATRIFHGIDSDTRIKPEDWNQHYSLFDADGVTLLKPEQIPLLRAFNDEKVVAQEMVVATNDGVKRSLLCSGSALFRSDGQKLGAVVAMQDITARKKTQASLEATNSALIETNRALRAASTAKSEFLANMSHEIRTPLNGVLGVADLLLDNDLNPEMREQVNMIQSSAEKLLVIIGDILDFSKIEAGKLEIEATEFTFESILNDIHRNQALLAKQKKLNLSWSLQNPPTSKFVGDPGRIQQVLNNLISNSIKFTASGGVITQISFQPGENDLTLVRIEVTDSGIGIPNETIPRLFQAFTQADNSTTRRYGGTGLGLSISKQLMTLMGGQIGVNSIEGKGSTFWITLPLNTAEPLIVPDKITLSPPTMFAEPAVLKNFRVLVAEDTPDILRVSMRMLEKLGLPADSATNGREALEAVKNHRYDLILMDCQMPEMDGYEATREIRKLADLSMSTTPIIAVTAHAMIGDREKCIESGMTDYLPKPMRLKELQEAIARYLPIQVTT